MSDGLGAAARPRPMTAALVRATIAPMTSTAPAVARSPRGAVEGAGPGPRGRPIRKRGWSSTSSRLRAGRPVRCSRSRARDCARRTDRNSGRATARRRGREPRRDADANERNGHEEHRPSGTPRRRQVGDQQHEPRNEKRSNQQPGADERVGPVDARRGPGHARPRESSEGGRDAADRSPGEPQCDPGGQQGQWDDASENGQPGGLGLRRPEAQGHHRNDDGSDKDGWTASKARETTSPLCHRGIGVPSWTATVRLGVRTVARPAAPRGSASARSPHLRSKEA